MDPATIIGIGSTLLGGLFAPKPKYVVPDYAKIRSGAEAAGFNPLTALTQGPAGQVVQPENYMGNAIASAGLMLADNLTKTARAARLQKLTGENERLQDKVQRLTLQPKIGGVYARRESVPTLGAALGASRDQSGVSAVADNGGSGNGGGNPAVNPSTAYNWLDDKINSASDDSSKVPQKPLWLFGHEVPPTSGTSDSEAIGSRYGEDFMSPAWFAGWGAAITDGYNYTLGSRFDRIGTAFGNDVAAWKKRLAAERASAPKPPVTNPWAYYGMGF